MATNFQIVIPNKLYRSGRIMPADIEYLISPILKVKKIISLDQGAANLISRHVPAGIEHIIYPIELGGNPTVQARGLAALIKNNVFDNKDDGATIVHCERGIDRTGLAVALYRAIKQHWSCEQIFQEADGKNYGSGLNPNVKKVFDMEICRYCSGDYCKNFIINNDKLETGPDTQPSNDGLIGENIITPAFNQQQSFSLPMDPTIDFYPGTLRTAKSKLRKKFFKKILKKKDEQDALDTGLISNMDSIPASSYNPVSGTIDVPNAGGLAGMSVLPQI